MMRSDSIERSSALSAARTFLFVPANRTERFDKALRSGADAVVLDLEDSVPPEQKAQAREAICHAWPDMLASGVPLVVRINAPDRTEGQDDVQWLRCLTAPAGVMVPKVESAASLDDLSLALPGTALLPLIETAAGYSAMSLVAAARGVLRLVVGHIDFSADTGIHISDDESELAPLRYAVAIATRMAGRAPAVDGVTADIDDDDRLRGDTLRALRFGFGAKLCIHPRQIGIVHEAFRPTDVEVAWARRVVSADAASGGAAVRLDGRMVDAPVVLQALRLLARSAVAVKA